VDNKFQAFLNKIKLLIPKTHIKRRLFMIVLVTLICVCVASIYSRQTEYTSLIAEQDLAQDEKIKLVNKSVLTQDFIINADAAPASISIAFQPTKSDSMDKPYTAQILKPDGSVLMMAEFGHRDVKTGKLYLGFPAGYDIRGEKHTLRITNGIDLEEDVLTAIAAPLTSEGESLLTLNGEPLDAHLKLQIGHRYISTVFWVVTIIILVAAVACILLWRENIANNVLLLLLVFGLIFCFVSPILDTPDETTHFEKTMMVSNGDFFRSHAEGNEISISYDEVERNRENTLVNTDLYGKSFSEKTRFADTGISQLFIGYLPQALGLAFAKLLHLNILPAFYMGRVFNLLFYAILAWVAIKHARKFKLFLGVIALMPMSLFLAASYNPDSFVFGLCLILVSYFINMYFDRSRKICFRNILIFTLLCALIAIKKYNYAPFLFLLFFIPSERFDRKRTKYLGGLFAFVVVVLAVFAVFYAIVSSEAQFASGAENALVGDGTNDNGANMNEQLNFMLANLGPVISMFAQEIVNTLGTTLNYAFSFGWTAYGTPGIVSIAFFAFIALVAFSYTRYEYHKDMTVGNTCVSMGNRIGILLVMFAVVVLSYLMMYLGWTAVGTMAIWGVQGRYLIPALFLLPMIGQNVFPLVSKRSYDAAKYNIIFISTLFLIATLFATATVYYTS